MGSSLGCPRGLLHDQLVADDRVVEAHRRVVDEGPADVGEVHLLDQFGGRPRKAEDSRSVGAERAVAVEERQFVG